MVNRTRDLKTAKGFVLAILLGLGVWIVVGLVLWGLGYL